MSDAVNPIPAGYPRLIPYVTVPDGEAAVEFYKKAFGAVESVRMAQPDGKVGHAELRFGDAVLMLSDEYPEHGALGPQAVGGSPVMLHMYVEDVDAVVSRAVEAGATLDGTVEDQFYGDRGGKIVDPFGHRWWIASHVEDVQPEELKRRATELFGMG